MSFFCRQGAFNAETSLLHSGRLCIFLPLSLQSSRVQPGFSPATEASDCSHISRNSPSEWKTMAFPSACHFFSPSYFSPFCLSYRLRRPRSTSRARARARSPQASENENEEGRKRYKCLWILFVAGFSLLFLNCIECVWRLEKEGREDETIVNTCKDAFNNPFHTSTQFEVLLQEEEEESDAFFAQADICKNWRLLPRLSVGIIIMKAARSILIQ